MDLMMNLPLSISGAQLGITITSLGLGLVAEPAFAKIIENFIADPLGLPQTLSHALAFGFALFIVVFIHMVIGEMVPKNLALTNPEIVLCKVARPHRAFVILFRPIIWFLNKVSSLLLKPFGIKQVDELGNAYTAKELHKLIGEVKTGGDLDQGEHDILAGALLFQDKTINSVIVPWINVINVSEGDLIENVIQTAIESGHSRLPVLQGKTVLGFLHVKDLLHYEKESSNLKLTCEMTREILIISPDQTLDDLLREMRETQIHFALVGGNPNEFVGIATLEDVVEAIVGEIIDESDKVSS
jgi:CBS domain containing-hemolysin-like protein